jgi:hypothetical protein
MQQIWNSNQPFCWMVIKSVTNPYNSSVRKLSKRSPFINMRSVFERGVAIKLTSSAASKGTGFGLPILTLADS